MSKTTEQPDTGPAIERGFFMGNPMKVKARHAFQHWTLGSILQGEVLDVDDETARKLGNKVMRYETKPEPVAPLAGGQASDAGSLHPARPARKKKRSKRSGTKAR